MSQLKEELFKQTADKVSYLFQEDKKDDILWGSNQKREPSAKSINPFLIFYSPDDSQKSLFNKKKRIRKLNRKCPILDHHETFKIQDIFINEETSAPLLFTQKTSYKNDEFGMLFISKLDVNKNRNLIYSTVQKTVMNAPVCKFCGKIFKNHSGVGGHVRLCKNGQKSDQSQQSSVLE